MNFEALVLTPLTGYASYVVMLWLLSIAGKLLWQGKYFDVAVRDIVLAVAAYSLARLREVRQEAVAGESASRVDVAVQRT